MGFSSENRVMLLWGLGAAAAAFVLAAALFQLRRDEPEFSESDEAQASLELYSEAESEYEERAGGDSPATSEIADADEASAETPAPEESGKRPVERFDSMSIESVMLREELQREQFEELRRRSRDNPDAPDALTEAQLGEIKEKGLIIY